jgi:hypothetical protein
VPDDAPVSPVEENYVSEFLSERSPEFDAIRRAAAEAHPQTPGAVPADAAPAPRRAAGTARLAPWGWLVAYAGVAAVVLTVVWVFQGNRLATLGSAPSQAGTEGTATIVSRPEGAEVFIDGQHRGVAPLRLSLPVGTYALELRNGAATRALTLSIDAATAVREIVDLAPLASTGRLQITSAIAGAPVAVDGVARGVTPLLLDEIDPGSHRIAIGAGGSAVYRTVTVEAGATATIVASPVPAGASGGWVTFTSPIDMQVIENGQVLGTTGASRLMLPAGRHELDLVAEPYHFRTTAMALVGVGRTITIPVSVPNGRLSINAVPWADVWLSGDPLGSTPLANVVVPIGDHTVTWRHPELGERQQTVRVTADTPARASVALNR